MSAAIDERTILRDSKRINRNQMAIRNERLGDMFAVLSGSAFVSHVPLWLHMRVEFPPPPPLLLLPPPIPPLVPSNWCTVRVNRSYFYWMHISPTEITSENCLIFIPNDCTINKRRYLLLPPLTEKSQVVNVNWIYATVYRPIIIYSRLRRRRYPLNVAICI